MREGSNGRRQSVIDGWTQLMGKDNTNNLKIAERKQDVVDIITNIFISHFRTMKAGDIQDKPKKDEMIL
jgi:hypothetical protein